MNLKDLIGQPEAAAIEAIKKAGLRPRVTGRDDEHYMVTMDFRTDRVNLVVTEGKVTRADIG